MSNRTSLLCLNKMSVLLNTADEFVLIDPYFEKNSFPVFSKQEINSFGKLTVLLTHPANFSVEFFQDLNKNSIILLSPILNSWVYSKLKKLRFQNIFEISYFGRSIGSFYLKSFINEESNEDALFLIRNNENMVIICHNVHFPISKSLLKIFLEERLKIVDGELVLLSKISRIYNLSSRYNKITDIKEGETYFLK